MERTYLLSSLNGLNGGENREVRLVHPAVKGCGMGLYKPSVDRVLRQRRKDALKIALLTERAKRALAKLTWPVHEE